MKKKILIIGAVSIVLIGVAAYFLFPFISGKDLSKYVPKNAIYVVKTDLAQLGGKLDFKELQDLSFIRKELMSELKSSQKESMETLLDNPVKSGIQFKTSPTFFIFDNGNNEMVAVLMWGISNENYFKTFLGNMSKELSIRESSGDNYFEISNENEKYVKGYFNDNVAMLLIDVNRKEIGFKKIRDKLLSLDKANSILSNDAYTSLNNQKNDVMSFLNKKELEKFAKDNENGISENDIKNLTYLPTAMTVNFNEDAVSFKAFDNDKSGKLQVLKDGGFTEAELKNIDSKGNPNAYMTVNFDPAKVIELAIQLLESYTPNAKEQFNQQADQIALMLNSDRGNLFKLLGGKMSLSYSGMGEQSKVDPYTMEPNNIKAPKINFWASVGNPSLMKTILEKAVEMGQATFSEGMYVMNENSYSPSIYVAAVGDNLFVSTDAEAIKNKVSNKEWAPLKEEKGKAFVTSKPTTAFIDLNYKNYQDLIESYVGGSEEVYEKLKKNVFPAFKHLSIASTDKESEVVLQLSEEKKNSLQRLLLIIDQAYKATN